MKNEKDFATAIFSRHYKNAICLKHASQKSVTSEDSFPSTLNISQIADAASATWSDIDSALTPVIGQYGVLALIKRSIHLQHVNYPVLKTIHTVKILSNGFPALHAVLVKETDTNAVSINNVLLNTFCELLTNLIGAALTEQLLQSVFETPLNGDPVQDNLS